MTVRIRFVFPAFVAALWTSGAGARYDASTRLWPSDATAWARLGLLLRQRGNGDRARAALERARLLQPSLELPGAGPAPALE